MLKIFNIGIGYNLKNLTFSCIILKNLYCVFTPQDCQYMFGHFSTLSMKELIPLLNNFNNLSVFLKKNLTLTMFLLWLNSKVHLLTLMGKCQTF